MSKLKIDLRPGSKLSERFSNRRDCYKVVEVDNVLAYVVHGGGRQSAAFVTPIYRADIHVKVGKVQHIISSFEHGDRLNEWSFDADYEGCTFATIVAQSIQALEERARTKKTSKRKARR